MVCVWDYFSLDWLDGFDLNEVVCVRWFGIIFGLCCEMVCVLNYFRWICQIIIISLDGFDLN